MVEDFDDPEIWKKYSPIFKHIGIPPRKADEQYLLKMMLFNIKLKLYNIELTFYRAGIYEIIAPDKDVPSFKDFLTSSGKDYIDESLALVAIVRKSSKKKLYSKIPKGRVREITDYIDQCNRLTTDLIRIEEGLSGPFFDTSVASNTIDKAIELIHEGGKFLGYWQRLKGKRLANPSFQGA